MGDSNGILPSSDDGELTDESGTDRRSRVKNSCKPFAHSSDDDEQEMFTMQPGDFNTSRLAHRLEKSDRTRTEKDKKDRDHKDRHERHQKHKHERRIRDRDHHSEKHDRDRSERLKYDERENRDRERHDEHRHKSKTEEKKIKPSPHKHDRTEKLKLDKLRDTDRDKNREDGHRERSARKQGRSSTGSSSPETDRKRDKKTQIETMEETKIDLKMNRSDNVKSAPPSEASIEQDDEGSGMEEQTNAVDQLQADFEESDEEENKMEITSFVLDSVTGPKKYSKFDSSPEPDELPSPDRSEAGFSYSDNEEEEEVQHVLDFDPKTAKYEDLTDEQRARLSPDSRQRLESDHQSRIVAALPVFYPGVMGCRNVQEFECVNRVQEGTFGVVFRAKDKRTDEIVALKRLKMEKEREGFPITSLREINMLLKAGSHDNIVNIKEILIGSSMDKIFVAMEFVEHDLKSLMDTMSKKGKRFSIGEQKTLMRQLLSGLAHMHHLWILHRDLKTSNLLLSHKGVLKIADFGLAREYGDPLNAYTPIVVTLWYRSPELLLGKKIYSTPVDMWSVGCIMAEFQSLKALFPGRGEMDQIKLIYQQMGTPSKEIWPEYEELPLVKQVVLDKYPYMQLRTKFPSSAMSDTGFKLLTELLTYDPDHRISAEVALNHQWFSEDPKPVSSDMFPTFPAKSEQHKDPPIVRKRKIPVVDENTAKLLAEFKVRPDQVKATGFSLKFDKTKF